MTQPDPSSPPAPAVAEICAIAELEPESTALLGDELSLRECVEALVEHEHYGDAVRFLAHLLPRREAIFWAWTTARRVLEAEPPPPVALAIDATGRWIAEPTEENRRPMLDVAQAADLGTPAGCAALAVFFSGGSIAPPDLPPVEPSETAAAKAITGSIMMAAVSSEPERAPEKFRDFIAQGIDIGRRVGLWSASPTT